VGQIRIIVLRSAGQMNRRGDSKIVKTVHCRPAKNIHESPFGGGW
jgi:hypothetical protein